MIEKQDYPDSPGFKEVAGASQEAAEAIEPVAGRMRRLVRDVICGAGRSPHGYTADEIAWGLGMSVLSIRPRVSELYRMGLIVKTKARRKNASGIGATVWMAA